MTDRVKEILEEIRSFLAVDARDFSFSDLVELKNVAGRAADVIEHQQAIIDRPTTKIGSRRFVSNAFPDAVFDSEYAVLEAYAQVRSERDAAINDLNLLIQTHGYCGMCRYRKYRVGLKVGETYTKCIKGIGGRCGACSGEWDGQCAENGGITDG